MVLEVMPMQKRIQVYADPEIKRRIELAAAKHDLPVTEYCMQAISQRLRDDDILEGDQIEIKVKPTQQDNLTTSLHILHNRILARRNGNKIDIDAMLELVREERDYEFTSLY